MVLDDYLLVLMKLNASLVTPPYLKLSSSSCMYYIPTLISDLRIHFISYGLIQSKYSFTVKSQIIQQDRFPEQTEMVPILHFSETITIPGLKVRLFIIPSVAELEPVYVTETYDKLSVVL